MAFRIMLAGGGTGGHVYPLVAIAEELIRQTPIAGKNVEIQFIGDGDLMADAARELKITYRRVLAPKWRRYFSVWNFVDILKAPIGLVQSFFFVWWFMPDVMLVKGGYAAFLPALAAKLVAVPLVVHESDSVPGKVNAWWGRHSRRVFLAFEHARKYFRPDRTEVIGNPIRPAVITHFEKPQALAAFQLGTGKPVIFISGGSQGAKIVNDVVLTGLVELVKKYSVIHQCGAQNYAAVDAQLKAIVKEEATTYAAVIQASYRLQGSLDEKLMAQAYSAADVIVSRAGSAIFELAAVGKPVIIIPLKGAAQNHQLHNAREFEQFGAVVLEEDNLTPHILLNEIARCYEHREEISTKIRAFAKPDAAAIIAKELLQAVS